MHTDVTDEMIVKYIALLALVKIVPSQPHLVAEYQETILSSVDDPDISIRMRALELVSEMVGYNPDDALVSSVDIILGYACQPSVYSSTTFVPSHQSHHITAIRFPHSFAPVLLCIAKFDFCFAVFPSYFSCVSTSSYPSDTFAYVS